MKPGWLSFIFVGILILMSGLFSGLTLGLLGLDLNGLEIVEGGDDERSREMARVIMPVRANGNLLLCTLLLGNVAVNALLSILMADLTSGLMGFVLSTIIIVIFGEIIPQASCSRYPLEIGSKTVPLVKVIMFFLYPATKPLAWALDRLLGDELGTIYSSAELIKLMRIHEREGQIDNEQTRTLEGALKYREMEVKEVMTPMVEVYTVSSTETLNYRTLREIFDTGFSRIPVHGPGGKNEIVGMLFVKDLIFIDPSDEMPVKKFVELLERPFTFVFPDEKLGEVLTNFKRGKGHMAIVRDTVEHEDTDNTYVNVGLITLEDIVEAILGDEIIDETDVYVHMERKASSRIERQQFDYSQLALMDPKLSDGFLSLEEVNAVTAHLCMNYRQFQETPSGKPISQDDVKALVSKLVTLSIEREGDGITEPPSQDVLYRRGRMNASLTLVLSGKLTVVAGKDNFRSDAGPWSVLGADAICQEEGTYIPDFTAFVGSDRVRMLRISRKEFAQKILKMRFDDPRRNIMENRLQRARKRAGSGSGAGTGNAGGGVGSQKDEEAQGVGTGAAVRFRSDSDLRAREAKEAEPLSDSSEHVIEMAQTSSTLDETML